MRSSPSSSDRSWIASWWVAVAIVVVVLAAWEVHWRARGFEPSVNDDKDLWAFTRRRASALGEAGVVLVGSSRMQMGIHRDAFAEVTGWEPAVQLAVVRGTSAPVLRSLARDDRFRGTVLCEINPDFFFARTPDLDESMRGYVAHYEGFTRVDGIEQRLRMSVQEQLVARLPALAPAAIWRAIHEQRTPLPGFNTVVTRDRFRYGDYRKVRNLEAVIRSKARMLAAYSPPVLPPPALDARIGALERAAAAIRDRGGEVVYLRLPTAAPVRRHEARWFPRRRFWDRLVVQVNGPAIHYQDYPELSDFRPPDGEHLGADEAVRHSRKLGEILVRLGIAPGRTRVE